MPDVFTGEGLQIAARKLDVTDVAACSAAVEDHRVERVDDGEETRFMAGSGVVVDGGQMAL